MAGIERFLRQDARQAVAFEETVRALTEVVK